MPVCSFGMSGRATDLGTSFRVQARCDRMDYSVQYEGQGGFFSL